MNTLLLVLILTWGHGTPSGLPEPDLLGFWVTTAERHVVAWVECPCPPVGVPCLKRYDCPEYNPFVWETTFTGYLTEFERTDCANVPHSLCVFRYPVAEDWAGNMSIQRMVTNEVWQ